LLRGVSDARVPMLIAVSAYWGIGLPSAWVLSAHTALGGKGVWVGLALGLLFAASLLTWRFYHRRRFWLNG
jgi:MATE family multidrug resistance protein